MTEMAETGLHGCKWLETAGNCQERGGNGWKWLNMTEMAGHRCIFLEMAEMVDIAGKGCIGL